VTVTTGVLAKRFQVSAQTIRDRAKIVADHLSSSATRDGARAEFNDRDVLVMERLHQLVKEQGGTYEEAVTTITIEIERDDPFYDPEQNHDILLQISPAFSGIKSIEEYENALGTLHTLLADKEEQVRTLKLDLGTAQQTIADLQAVIDELRTEVGLLRGKLEAAPDSERNSQLQKRIEDLMRELGRKEGLIEYLQDQAGNN